MTAQTIDPLPETMEVMPSYTVDDLFTLPENGSVRVIEGAAGEEHQLPLAVGPDTWIDVTLDPADLDTR
jgi:hypothetical protein